MSCCFICEALLVKGERIGHIDHPACAKKQHKLYFHQACLPKHCRDCRERDAPHDFSFQHGADPLNPIRILRRNAPVQPLSVAVAVPVGTK